MNGAPDLAITYQKFPDWEAIWTPYDQRTYQSVIQEITVHDFVLDLGAGDLRLAVQITAIARRVIAVEIQEPVILSGPSPSDYPSNLHVVRADALTWQFPVGITTAVLLMRYCSHFQIYVEKLRRVGCRRLITNARWRTHVEVVDLCLLRLPYHPEVAGWYACLCGAVGFTPGSVDTIAVDYECVSEYSCCPVYSS